ncbi:nucleotidyl transferase AbiEii/AbiGii toxin family protein [Candidatus Gottesmanbacteria bacterium]|nr:nucleotidyl transferase AbiEii/AbiGii toxin family protein [Candidatus Gottesmanbacteria bacterium]
MFLENLKQIYQLNKGKQALLLRNILKETVQFYILDYIYKSVWGESFVMKGGTCLRFCFGLPRLSEDLDFDIENYDKFKIDLFVKKIKEYFTGNLQYRNFSIKTARSEKILYLKFPILQELGQDISKTESNILHVRIDLSQTAGKSYRTEISIKSTYDFSFIIRRYSLPDLFTGKLAAILTREAWEGKVKKARYKGRDYYDLIWFLEKNVLPNWLLLEEITGLGREKAVAGLEEKIKEAEPNFLKDDLLPFIENIKFVENFSQNFKQLFEQYRSVLKK